MTMATMSTPAGSNSQRSMTGAGAAAERHSQQVTAQVRKQAKQVWLRLLFLHAAMHVMEAV